MITLENYSVQETRREARAEARAEAERQMGKLVQLLLKQGSSTKAIADTLEISEHEVMRLLTYAS